MENLDTDTWEISFGDFDMGVVDGNPGNLIHKIDVKKFHSSKNFFLLQYDFFNYKTSGTFYLRYEISASNILPTI